VAISCFQAHGNSGSGVNWDSPESVGTPLTRRWAPVCPEEVTQVRICGWAGQQGRGQEAAPLMSFTSLGDDFCWRKQPFSVGMVRNTCTKCQLLPFLPWMHEYAGEQLGFIKRNNYFFFMFHVSHLRGVTAKRNFLKWPHMHLLCFRNLEPPILMLWNFWYLSGGSQKLQLHVVQPNTYFWAPFDFFKADFYPDRLLSCTWMRGPLNSEWISTGL
jgi:hypothetical protein